MIFTYEQIDRTMFEYLRLAVVAAGYLPDINDYLPATEANATAYDAAKAAIKASGKTVIEIEQNDSPDGYGEKKIAAIVITQHSASKGSIGGGPSTFFESTTVDEVTTFKKYRYPRQTKTLRYHIRCISNDTTYMRIMKNLLDTTFDTGSYLKAMNADTYALDGTPFYIENIGEADMGQDKTYEYLYIYEVQDVFITPATLILDNIPAMVSTNYRLAVRPLLNFPSPDTIQPDDVLFPIPNI